MRFRGLQCLLSAAFLLLGNPASAEAPRVGLVLGGGGARGAAHIGVLEVLEKHRVKVACVAGTSMGGLVAGAFAGGLTPARMRDELAQANWHDMFLDNPDYSEQGYRIKKMSRRFIPGLEMGVTEKGVELPSGIVAGQKIRMFFNHLVQAETGERAIESLAMPLSIVATDIGSGERVVFERGSLTTAMRASMSVPGMLSPVDFEGRKLVDGGLVDNVPISVVRERCKPDVVIAVNVGSPLLKPEQIGSLLSVSAQMVNILTEQNVTRSLATLLPTDIYIKPDLDGISAGDFERHAETADRGRAAAELVVAQLKALSSSPEEYAAWRKRVDISLRQRPVVDEIQVAKLRFVNPAAVERFLRVQPGEEVDPKALYQDIQRIYGDGHYERVEYTVLPLRDRKILQVAPVEKPWGPDYLRFGFGLQSDSFEGSSYLLRAAYDKTWLNPLGGELLVSGEIGNRPAFLLDYYQPLDPQQRFFAEASYSFRRESQGIYQKGDRLAEYRLDQQRINLNLGSNLGVYGQARFGWVAQHRDSEVTTGVSSLPSQSITNNGWYAALDIDQFDRRYFPTRGWKSEFRYFDSQSQDYGRFDAKLDAAKSFGDYVFIGSFARSVGTNGKLPYFDPAAIGGLFRLSAFTDNQILGGSAALYGVHAEKIIGRMPLGINGDVRIGVGLERGRVSDRYTETTRRGWIDAASVYLASETPIGPVYLGYSRSDEGSSNIYLVIGTP